MPNKAPSIFHRAWGGIGTLQKRFEATRAGRAFTRFGDHNGNVLAGGIAYYSLASIAAGALLSATVVAFAATRSSEVRDAVVGFIEGALPGLVASKESEGLLDPTRLEATPIAGVAGIVALLVLLNTATRYVGGLRSAVRAMLGRGAGSPITDKLHDIGALVALAIIAAIGAVLQVGASRAGGWLASLFTDEAVSGWVVRGPALVAGVITDVLFVAVALYVLGRASVRPRQLWRVLIGAAVAIGVLRLGSSLLVSGTLDNPVLGPFAAIITVLIFVDMVGRVMLLAAAWVGADPEVIPESKRRKAGKPI